MKNPVKTGLLIFFIGILTIPLIQYYFPIIELKPLEGSFEKKQYQNFSRKGWFEGSFQSKYDSWYNENFGFRNELVRLHNQVGFSVFGQSSSKYVIVGKKGYLYENEYLKSYYGDNYIGQNAINRVINILAGISEYLVQNNTKLMVVIAPGKGFFYPEYIPNNISKTRDTTNYEIYIKELEKAKIPFIDFNREFLNRKDTSSITLYPKTGIHWSQASIPFVLDSLNNYVEYLTKIPMAGMKFSYKEPTSIPDRQDADIERSLNLLYPIDNDPFLYPNWQWEEESNKRKPKAIFIGDSFFWQIYNLGTAKRFYDNGEFWYYYKQAYSQKYTTDTFVEDIDILSKITDADVVVLITTETNLYKFPFGFESVFEKYGMSEKINAVKIKNLMDYIKTDIAWMNHIKEKAEVKNISVDSMLYLDAKYMILNQKK
jgi:hypothetical protein